MARKILFYTHAFGGGGAEVVFERLATAFAEAGDTVLHVADYEGPQPVEPGRNPRRVMLGAGHVGSTLRLASLLRRERPDISFSALGAQNLKHLLAAVLVGRTRRCVLGYHGFAEAEQKLLSRLSFWATPLTTRLAAKTICVSDSLLANLRTEWRASTSRTMRIYNPVGANSGDPITGLEAAPPLILGCGRLVPIKRFQDLLAAFAQLEPTTAKLVILGAGPERASLIAEAYRLGIADRFELPGHVADPTQWYRRATCLAITSQSESFGLTAAEALAHGVPVVSTDCGGPSEILGQGRYGQIVSIGDIGGLAAALTQTLANPGDPADRVRRAEDFKLAAIQKAYAALIDQRP